MVVKLAGRLDIQLVVMRAEMLASMRAALSGPEWVDQKAGKLVDSMVVKLANLSEKMLADLMAAL